MNQKLRDTIKKIGYDKFIIAIVAGIVLITCSIPSIWGKSDKSETEQDSVNSNKDDETADFADTVEQNLNQTISSMTEAYTSKQKEELIKILSNVEGVGAVDVMITYNGSSEYMLADNNIHENTYQDGGDSLSTTSTNFETVIISNAQGADVPILVKIYYPNVEGVVICAKGAESDFIKSEITQAVMVLFRIPIHKIKVLTMADME